tara:strand:- start:2309 stop:3283 length:975 start_codon:yes stop_codon:yes gene_type:complete
VLKKILISGGTGSFGKAFIKKILEERPECERLVIFSRDELKQWEIFNEISEEHKSKIRMFLGDVRDKERLRKALEGIDYVVHAAALKQVPASEYNPFEFIKTNVYGTQNIVDCSIEQGVKKLIALSTDKAAAPVNLYGASKLCADRIVMAANNVKGSTPIKLSVVRYGNVFGSRGSVVPFFIKQKANGKLNITHKEMTRFNITLEQGVDLVINSLIDSNGGEIIVPKIPSYRILDIAAAIAPEAELVFTGIRPGEKIHEEMITKADSFSTYFKNDHYIILRAGQEPNSQDYEKVPEGFSYNSRDNENFLSVNEIRNLLINHNFI